MTSSMDGILLAASQTQRLRFRAASIEIRVKAGRRVIAARI